MLNAVHKSVSSLKRFVAVCDLMVRTRKPQCWPGGWGRRHPSQQHVPHTALYALHYTASATLHCVLHTTHCHLDVCMLYDRCRTQQFTSTILKNKCTACDTVFHILFFGCSIAQKGCQCTFHSSSPNQRAHTANSQQKLQPFLLLHCASQALFISQKWSNVRCRWKQ